MRQRLKWWSLVAVLGLCALVFATDAAAQTLVPCCEGGFKPDKRCELDDECPDVCVGGFRDGKPCSTSPCLDACVGGVKDGQNCDEDNDCQGVCEGGNRDGQPCRAFTAPDCPDGACVNFGTCSNIGTCSLGTCTGLCEKKPPKESPSEPVADWLYPVSMIDLDEE